MIQFQKSDPGGEIFYSKLRLFRNNWHKFSDLRNSDTLESMGTGKFIFKLI